MNWAKGSLGSRDDKRHSDYVMTRFAELCADTPQADERLRMSATYTQVRKALGACDEPEVVFHDTVVDPRLDWSCDWPNGVRPIASELTVDCQSIWAKKESLIGFGDIIGESYTGEDDKTEQCANITPMLQNGMTHVLCRNMIKNEASAFLSRQSHWPRNMSEEGCGHAQDNYYKPEFDDVGEHKMNELSEWKETDNQGSSSSDVGYTQPGTEPAKRLCIQVVDRQDTTDGEAAGLECGDILRQTGARKQLKHRKTC